MCQAMCIVPGADPTNSADTGLSCFHVSYRPSLHSLPSLLHHESHLLSYLVSLPHVPYFPPGSQESSLGTLEREIKRWLRTMRPRGKDPEWASPSPKEGQIALVLQVKGSTLHSAQ